MKIKLNIDMKGMTKILKDPVKARAEIVAAATAWEAALNPLLTPEAASREYTVDISFGIIPEKGVDAAARTYLNRERPLTARILISNGKGMALCHQDGSWIKKKWFGAIDLHTLMRHEIGHAIGIPHVGGKAPMNSIMDPEAPFSTHKGPISKWDAENGARILNAK